MKRGFALVELLVVIGLLGILSCAGLRTVRSVLQRTRIVAAKAQISQIALVLEHVRKDTGYFPVQLNDVASRQCPAGHDPARWQGPYLNGTVPNDPWQQAYRYEIPISPVFDSPPIVRGHGTPLTETYQFDCGSGDGVLRIENYGVTSSSVRLNGQEIVTESEFKSNPVDFQIGQGKVTPQEAFTAEMTVLGVAISYGGQYDMPVTAKIRVGNTWLEGWGPYGDPKKGNLNDGKQHAYNLPGQYPAGTSMGVVGKSWVKSGNKWVQHMEVSSWTGSQNVIVLRNGDPVPPIAPFLNQQQILYFVRDYVDPVTKKIVLDDNQAIWLFELGTTNLSSPAADFQDLVVLVSLSPAGSGGGGGNGYRVQIIQKDVSLLEHNTLETYTRSKPGTYYTVTINGLLPTEKYFLLSSYGMDKKPGGQKMNRDIIWVSDYYPNFQ